MPEPTRQFAQYVTHMPARHFDLAVSDGSTMLKAVYPAGYEYFNTDDDGAYISDGAGGWQYPADTAVGYEE